MKEKTKDPKNTKNLRKIFIFRVIGFVLLIIGGLGLMIYGRQYFWKEVWFLFEICVLTFFTRSVFWKTGLSVWLKGVYIGGLLAVLVNGIIFGTFPGFVDTVAYKGFFVAFDEELFKFIPVLIMAYIFYKRAKKSFGLSDWLWLSVLSGTAFSMLEKIFYAGVHFDLTYGPRLGSLYFFPDALGNIVHREALGYIGHGAATGFIGLTFALGLYLKHRITLAKFFWWLLPLGGYLWVSLEHAFYNSYNSNPDPIWLSLGGGQFTPYLFLILTAVLLGIDGIKLRAFLKKNPSLYKNFLSDLKKLPKLAEANLIDGLKEAWLLTGFWRMFNHLRNK